MFLDDIFAAVFSVIFLLILCAPLTFWFYKVGRYWGLIGGVIIFSSFLCSTLFPAEESSWRDVCPFLGLILPLIGAHLHIRQLRKECEALKKLVEQD